ncbi:MAG: DUF481 domain-containing protein [Opitutales bacterium]|nr:DUF481 domain-containing protein [Opitutales bacterium]
MGAVVEVDNGTRLVGIITKIEEGVVYLDPGFTGVIKVPMDRVVRIESDEPISIRTERGEIQTGSLRSPEEGTIAVSGPAGSMTTPMNQIASGWQQGARDPIAVAEQAALKAQLRRWSYQAGADISGRSGNADSQRVGMNFRAVLSGPNDRLEFYGSYDYAETDGQRGADELKGGTRFTSFFSGDMGWFLRTELERDTFEGIDFRSTNAAGLTYRFIKRDGMDLEGSAGFSYRYETYMDGGTEDYPGLDFGLLFNWRFADWGRLTSTVSYVPSVEDFRDYLLEQDTGVEIPLGSSDFWRLRIGLNNRYNSDPDTGREKLDTAYYLRLLLSWE